MTTASMSISRSLCQNYQTHGAPRRIQNEGWEVEDLVALVAWRRSVSIRQQIIRIAITEIAMEWSMRKS